MANTSAVYARIDSNLKDNAEHILEKLGISPSSAIQMLYSQIVLQQGMPFESRLPRAPKALDMTRMTQGQIVEALEKGYDDLRAGRVMPAKDAFDAVRREHGL